MRKLLIPAAAALSLLLIGGTAFADSHVNVGTRIFAHFSDEHGDQGDQMHMATSTRDREGDNNDNDGTTSPDMRDMRHGTTTPFFLPPVTLGVPGTVASIGTTTFTLTTPFGKDHATTTLTVNIASTTIFSRASTTASLANLTVGTHVVVLGKVSTSTMSIAAKRVIITGDLPKKIEDHGLKGVLSHIRDIFGKHASSTDEHASTSSAAAVEDGGFLSNLLHSIFGWL